MQQLKALFEGNKVETELFVAHVNEISAAGWVKHNEGPAITHKA